jgi:hypothetical protein
MKNIFLASLKSLKKGVESGSIIHWYGSGDPDPHQNVTDPQHCCTMCTTIPLVFPAGVDSLIEPSMSSYMKMHAVWVWAILKITISWESILSVVLYAVKSIYVTIFYFRVVLEEN